MSDKSAQFEEIPNAKTLAAMKETDEMILTGEGEHFMGTIADFFAMLDAGNGR